LREADDGKAEKHVHQGGSHRFLQSAAGRDRLRALRARLLRSAGCEPALTAFRQTRTAA
jgi:hypothetical protein